MEDANSEESGNDRKRIIVGRRKNVDAGGGGKGLWFAVSWKEEEKLKKNNSPQIWKASSQFDWAKG